MLEANQMYEQLYATRRNIPIEWVHNNERLQFAAYLEWQVETGMLDLYQARKKYVAEYPESNRLAVSKTVIEHYGYKYEDKRYAAGSVLSMIQNYEIT